MYAPDKNYETQAIETVNKEFEFKVVNTSILEGGHCFNGRAIVETEQRKLFLKFHQEESAFAAFQSEYYSLALIKAHSLFKVPEPIKVLKHPNGGAILVAECLDDLGAVTNFPEMGRKLAHLHALNQSLQDSAKDGNSGKLQKVEKFGSDHDFFFSSFRIKAAWCNTWQELLVNHILDPLFSIVQEKYKDATLGELWSELKPNINKAFQGVTISPTILHGDVNLGNFFESKGEIVALDSQSFYGHWLFDLAICTLSGSEEADEVGNLPKTFFEAYFNGKDGLKDMDTILKIYYMVIYLVISNLSTDFDSREAVVGTGKDILSSLKKKSGTNTTEQTTKV